MTTIHISGHEVEISAALRDMVHHKMMRVTKRFEPITRIEVILSKQRAHNLVEATVHIPHETFNAKGVSNDMYKAIDLMVDKLDRQMQKHKEKLHEHRTPMPTPMPMPTAEAEDDRV